MTVDLRTVIDRCYAASLDAGAWPAALTAVADYLGGTDTTLEAHRGPGTVPLFFAAGSRLPMHGIDAYIEHYSKVCPRIAYISARPAGEVGYDSAFISESEMDRDEFYADFLAPDRLRYFLSATLANSKGSGVSFAAVHRSPRQGHASREDARRMKRLVPHLRHALDTHLRLEASARREGALLELLGRLDTGVVLLDPAGRVLHANAIAEAIFRDADGLSAASAHLGVANADARKRLNEILARFLGDAMDAELQPGGEIVVPRPSGRLPYILSAAAPSAAADQRGLWCAGGGPRLRARPGARRAARNRPACRGLRPHPARGRIDRRPVRKRDPGRIRFRPRDRHFDRTVPPVPRDGEARRSPPGGSGPAGLAPAPAARLTTRFRPLRS